MTSRQEFEQAARSQNAAADRKVAEARESGAPCNVVDMLAFGGVPYCTTHRTMGPCPWGSK